MNADGGDDQGRPARRQRRRVVPAGYSDENFENGDPTAWVIVSGNFFGADGNPEEASTFYLPEIADPVVSGTPFRGLQHVGRTLDNGWRQGDARGEPPRVHHVRRPAGLR